MSMVKLLYRVSNFLPASLLPAYLFGGVWWVAFLPAVLVVGSIPPF